MFSFQRTGGRSAGCAAGVRQTAESLCGNTPGFVTRRVPGCTRYSPTGYGTRWIPGRTEVEQPRDGHWWLLLPVVHHILKPTRRLCGAGRYWLRQGRNYPTVRNCPN